MEPRPRVVRIRVGIALLLAALSTACAPAAHEEAPTPDWLRTRIGEYEKRPAHEVPSAIWRIRHQGAPAFFVVSPCCDQFDPLLDAKGEVLCNPSGGFTGRGDGKCPLPMDEGTEAELLWAHPASREKEHAPPGLGG